MSQSIHDREIRIGIDIGCEKHYVAIGLSTGERIEGFELLHNSEAINLFFRRIEKVRTSYNLPVSIAMEGYNGYARPIDRYVLERGYRLFNVNNIKLARFKEIFPGPAKDDPIDAWKILELFVLKDTLPAAKNVLQEVGKVSEVNEKLKHFTRRRRVLVNENTRLINRLQGDLQATCPGLLSITGNVANLWFLRFLSARDDVRKLARIQRKSLLEIKGVGKNYADIIQQWQKQAKFSSTISWMGETIVHDVVRALQLHYEIEQLDKLIDQLILESNMASRLMTITGFGPICSGEIAGEIGTLDRFSSEASLALYLGMAVLNNKSGKYEGTKNPRNVNVRAKMAMMTAISRHIDHSPEAKKYYDKKRAEGKKHNQAVRSFGCHMVRVIWSMLKQDRDYIKKDNKFIELAEEKSTATCSWEAQRDVPNGEEENSPCPFGEGDGYLFLGSSKNTCRSN